MFSAKGIGNTLFDVGMALFGANQQRKSEARSFEYNKRLANLQWDRAQGESKLDREFQERMSSTAYQRAMADMRAGGLNPILAYTQGPASTPGGRGASLASPGSVQTRGDAAVRAASAAAAIRNMREQNSNLAAQRGQIEATTEKTRAETRVIDQQGDRGDVHNLIYDFILGLIGSDAGGTASSAGAAARNALSNTIGNLDGVSLSSAAQFVRDRVQRAARETRERTRTPEEHQSRRHARDIRRERSGHYRRPR